MSFIFGGGGGGGRRQGGRRRRGGGGVGGGGARGWNPGLFHADLIAPRSKGGDLRTDAPYEHAPVFAILAFFGRPLLLFSSEAGTLKKVVRFECSSPVKGAATAVRVMQLWG